MLTPEIVETFQRDGFVVVPDLLSADEVEHFEAAVTGAVRRRREGIDIAALAERSRYQQSFIQCMNLWEDDGEVALLDVPPADRPSGRRAPRGRRRSPLARPGALQGGGRTRDRRAPGSSVLADQETASVTAWIPLWARRSHRARWATCRAAISSACASSSTSSSASPTTSSPTPRSAESSPCTSRCRRDRWRSTTGSPCTSRSRTPPTAIVPSTRSSTSRTEHARLSVPALHVDRGSIEVGEVINSDATPVVWPRPVGEPIPRVPAVPLQIGGPIAASKIIEPSALPKSAGGGTRTLTDRSTGT